MSSPWTNLLLLHGHIHDPELIRRLAKNKGQSRLVFEVPAPCRRNMAQGIASSLQDRRRVRANPEP